MRDQVRAHDVAQRVLQLHRLDEEIVLRVEALSSLRRFQVKAQPFLNADGSEIGRALGQIEEEHQIERNRSGQDRVAAEEVDLELHRVAKPAEDVDVVPRFFLIAARRVVVDADLVVDVAV